LNLFVVGAECRQADQNLSWIFDIFCRYEMRREHDTLTPLKVPNISADCVHHANTIAPQG
jgi:hypothetical protein